MMDAVDFTGAKLTDAIFRGTVLTSVALDKLNLAPTQLAGCVMAPSAAARSRVAIFGGQTSVSTRPTNGPVSGSKSLEIVSLT